MLLESFDVMSCQSVMLTSIQKHDFYKALKHYPLFNKDILIGFTGAFLTSAVTSQAIAEFTSPLINSLVSLVADVSIFLTVFGILFYLNNIKAMSETKFPHPQMPSGQ